MPSSIFKTLSALPISAPEDRGVMGNCNHAFISRILACSPELERCNEERLYNKTISWNFNLVLSNFDQNIASLNNLEFDDWRNIIYDSRIFDRISASNVHIASFIGCIVMMLPLFTGTVLGANVPSALASPTKKMARGVLSAITALLIVMILIGVLTAVMIERDLLLDKFGEGSIRHLSFPLTVISPLFIIITVITMSTVAAGQYMLTAKSLLLSLITSHRFRVPDFFFYRKHKLRHMTAVLLTMAMVALFALLRSVDCILIASGCAVLGALSLINFCAAINSVLQLPRTESGVVLVITICAIVYYTGNNMITRRYSLRAYQELLLDLANMLLFTIPVGEFSATLSGAAEQILYHYHMHRVCIRQCNLILVKGHFPLTALFSQFVIDVWWIIDSGDTLVLLAHLLKRNESWRRAIIRLFVVIETLDDGNLIEEDIRRWLRSNRISLQSVEIIYADCSFICEYTSLRGLKISQRFGDLPKQSVFAKVAKFLGLFVLLNFLTIIDTKIKGLSVVLCYDGNLLQSAVDKGYHAGDNDTELRSSFSYKSLPSKQANISKTEQLLRAQSLNRMILDRSSESFLILLNIPEPPAQLERFWIYLLFIDKLTEGVNRALLIRGIDCETLADNCE
ncbi:unnamed protein product [Anisakis simplex]|uniref:STAS domain-containing protein n=1 Tax=Anisakis simplex TaxID=6269 RepID=A0A158PN02_ANISI|nr:unnamed protein product [Anisakis simplex]